jgi:molybdopterin synthase catalytic subunit
MKNIYITSDRLDSDACTKAVTFPDAGGLVVFVGNVRNVTKGKSVKHLVFEAYEKMAAKEMAKIIDEATIKWDLKKMIIHHRTGLVQVGESAVIIACAAAHRKAAFEACEYAIDRLKETVPIWKKEFFEDGEVWVSAHP